jgi:FtsP/CotA-like multicopper oxidase with cupredoxin domain
MHLKTALVIIGLGMSLSLLGDKAAPSPEGQTPGRYMLYSGKYWGGAKDENGLFRIDTATGRTWQMITIVQSGDGNRDHIITTTGWDEVNERPFETAEKLKSSVK